MTEVDRECRHKALDLIVISLTQYVTLSTFAIGGLLTYYSCTSQGSMWLWFAIILFTICSICSIICVNSFVYKVELDDFFSREKLGRILNFISIIAFICGILCSSIYISTSQTLKQEKIFFEYNGKDFSIKSKKALSIEILDSLNVKKIKLGTDENQSIINITVGEFLE